MKGHVLFSQSTIATCFIVLSLCFSAVGAAADETPSSTASAWTTSAPDYRGFIQGGYSIGRVYSEFGAGRTDRRSSFVGSAAYLQFPFAIKVDARQDEFISSDNTGGQGTLFRTPDGALNFSPQFDARQSNVDARLELELLDPHIYLGVGYLQTANNYGFPKLRGVGLGLEKLPDFDPSYGIYFSAFYYPTVTGKFDADPAGPNPGQSFTQQYRLLKYDVAVDVPIQQSPIYLAAGFSGDRFYHRHGATLDQTHAGPYVALGVRF
ncbi:MAG: hypothetical protein DLM53_06190 [Candidatus Eremiobacter antarcticus]|nr:hypothetical protein [Candidatus Eremiobacteraeota bacterium]PZR62402.1 MAG: hypothetical protein DLM53_06190 [Candidatus Eremiobacter sp. RRmetagenome_bin22]